MKDTAGEKLHETKEEAGNIITNIYSATVEKIGEVGSYISTKAHDVWEKIEETVEAGTEKVK
jgi:hypothetical protein